MNSPIDRVTGDGSRYNVIIAEFIGTFLFVYLGQSASASFELLGTQNDTIIRQLATSLSCGLAFLFATVLTLNISGSHLNPAYSFANAVFGYTSWSRASSYLCAQYLGSFIAAILLHATYNDKLNQRHLEGLLTGANTTLKAHGNILSTGKLFSSYPPTEVSLIQLVISYVLANAHLMLFLISIQEAKLINIPHSIKPFYRAAAMVLVHGAFSANGGPVLNPAQDLSPRLYISLSGWGLSAFNLYHHNYWWLCGVLAPHLGALIGFGLHQLLMNLAEAKKNPSYNDAGELVYTFNKDSR